MATVAKVEEKERMAPAEPGQMAMVWKRFRKHRLGLVGLITLILLLLSVTFVPMLLPFNYDQIDDAAATVDIIANPAVTTAHKPMFWQSPAEIRDYSKTFVPGEPPPMVANVNAGKLHILGTDDIGRDNMSRLFFSGRISLAIGVITTLIVVIIGSIVGALAGFYGGWVDTVLMRFVDLLLALPGLPVLLVLSQALGDSGFMNGIFGPQLGTIATIILVLSILGWLTISRLVRGSILSLRGLDFVEATRALGATNGRIIMRHLMPNSFAPIIVASTLAVGDFIITESALSFLGIGIRPPTPTWGKLLDESREYSGLINNLNPFEDVRAYLIIFPGLMILLTVLAINFIGDALRDALDPRLKT